MATKKEMMLQLLKGVSRNDTARSLRCSKATVARCAAKMEEEGIDSAGLEAMTDAEVSGLFADGRGKRGEEHLEPGYARVCDQLARVPKMALALQWARYTDCNPGGKRLYGCPGFCRRVGRVRPRARPRRPHRARARQDDARGLGGDHRVGLRPGDRPEVARVPFRRVAPLVVVGARRALPRHADALLDRGARPCAPGRRGRSGHHRARQLRHRDGPRAQVGAGEGQRRLPRDGRALRLRRGAGARAEAEGQGVRGEGGRPVRDVGARPARRRAPHEPRRAQRRGAEARRRTERQALLPARGLPRRRVLRRGAGRPEPAAGGALRAVRVAPPQGVARLPRAVRPHAPLGAAPPGRQDRRRAPRRLDRGGARRRRDRGRAPAPARPQGPVPDRPRPHAARARRGAVPVDARLVRAARRGDRARGEEADGVRPRRAPHRGAGLRPALRHPVALEARARGGARGRVRAHRRVRRHRRLHARQEHDVRDRGGGPCRRPAGRARRPGGACRRGPRRRPLPQEAGWLRCSARRTSPCSRGGAWAPSAGSCARPATTGRTTA